MGRTDGLAAALFLSLFLLSSPGALRAQYGTNGKLDLRTGKSIYQAACVGCHGPKGQGMPKSVVGFDAPKTFPDFTRCDQTTPEFNRDYQAVIRDGGPARGFSPIMPSFRDALTAEQIAMVVQTLRGFCEEHSWPRGELNFPRALVTEKAFPEDEVVITSAVNTRGAPGISNELAYEERFGKTSQLEVALPFSFEHEGPGSWFGGLGDIAVGVKQVLFSSLQTGTVLSLQGEVVLPTGNVRHGLGTGVTGFGTFASFGQMLPGQSFFQMQAGADLPTDTAKAPQSVFLRIALGKSLSQGRGLGRMWSPIMEFIADRDLETGSKTNWDILPQFQLTLSRRQHIRANLGVRVPVTNSAGRPVELVMYLLWDTADGGLFEGWR